MALDGADDLVVNGYVLCRCGRWVVDPVGNSTTGLCDECRARVGSAAHEQQFRYEVEGRVITARPRVRKKAKRKQKPAQAQTTEQRAARRGRDRARIRALVRLQHIYRPMFDVLYAEELLREGLSPEPLVGRPRPKAISAELLRDIQDAAERDEARGDRLRAQG